MKLFFLVLFYIFSSICESSENDLFMEIIDEAAQAGHRDIGFIERGDTLTITYWPLGFRNDYAGFIDLRQRISRYIEQKKDLQINNVELIQTSWGVPIIQANFEKYCPSHADKFEKVFKMYLPKDFRNTHYRSKKLLLQFNIPLSIKFGSLLDPFIFKTGFRPDFRFLISPGIIAYSQVDLYVYNEFDPQMWYKPANLGFVYLRPFSKKNISVTNIGAFTHKDIYGIDEEIKVFLFDDKFFLGIHLGLYGSILFNDNRFTYTEIDKKLAIGSLTWSYSRYDCSIKLTGGRFLNGDKGGGIGISRIFNEVEIGFLGIYSGNEFNGYIDFSVPLFPKSRKSLAFYGVAPVRNLCLSYRYDSKTISHGPKEDKKGLEPEVGISYKEFEGLARPIHFRHLSIISE